MSSDPVVRISKELEEVRRMVQSKENEYLKKMGWGKAHSPKVVADRKIAMIVRKHYEFEQSESKILNKRKPKGMLYEL